MLTMDKAIRKTSELEAYLSREIIGQEAVIKPLAECFKYGWCRLSTPERPRGNLFLLGPTGVGKTESVHAVTKFMYGTPHTGILRLDMSEFSRQAGEEALINLLGAPGGKVLADLNDSSKRTMKVLFSTMKSRRLIRSFSPFYCSSWMPHGLLSATTGRMTSVIFF